MDIICKNCGDVITKNYCANCGDNDSVRRIDRNYAVQEVLYLIGFEKGFLYTAKLLLLKPGLLLRTYIHESRQKITKPITFLVITSVIYTVISKFFGTDKIASDFSAKAYGDSSLTSINIWIQENMGYANILMIMPITFWARIFFKKYGYNFYETFLVISFVMGFGMLIFSLEPPIANLFPSKILVTNSLLAFLAFIYAGWAIGQFYGKTIKNYFKAFLSYIFGFITFQIVVTIIAVVNNMILKK
ncbi:DUF3667 domain-containing protein [Chryseobacterium salipaludis]|uniref:DUF3667 domain-containing protein n=1 Tax=Chryseobacterium TaxID=59732 RepID=UPI001FF43C61|nr:MULTISPECIES: DUF3667 domain-containing protein [Chryseobacterium]MCJ8497126.1 DUF3667 domain-containing protein [Chryseobacterium salipaludis]MCX3296608.1 DUF3667 domain-containing protein [Planobacterium sp. JC490]